MTATPEPRPEVLHADTLITPEQAIVRQQDGALLIDVRSPQGQAQDGLITGAVPVSKADAPAALDPRSHTRIPELSGDLDQEIVVFCGSEAGSDPIIDQLRKDGYRHVHQIEGGVTRWVAEGHPTVPVEDASDATA